MRKTRMLLALIPLDIIVNIRAFQNFFSEILFKNKK